MIAPDGVVQRARVAAYAWCEQAGAVLLVRISPGEPGAGCWTVPGGGLAFGEDPVDALRREVLEETGLEAEPEAILGIRSRVYGPGQTRSGHRIHFVGVLYAARVTGGTLRDELDESTDLAAWVPVAELATLPSVELLDWARGVAGH